MSVRKEYGTVARLIWRDTRIRGAGEDARTLALYLLTAPTGSTEGFYPLEWVLLTSHLRWSDERTGAALAALAFFATYDQAAQVVLIHKRLKFEAPAGKQVLGAVRALERVQDSPALFWRFLEAADRYAPGFAAAIREHYGIRSGTPSKGYPPQLNSISTPTQITTPEVSDLSGSNEGGEVAELCHLHAGLVLQRDPTREVAPDGHIWRDTCSTLLQTYTPADLAARIRECDGAARSMPKLRIWLESNP